MLGCQSLLELAQARNFQGLCNIVQGTVADMPLERTEIVRTFYRGTANKLALCHVETHLLALKNVLHNQPVSIAADETTNIQDYSISCSSKG